MQSFKDIKKNLKKILIGITAGLTIAGAAIIYNKNAQDKDFQKLPKEYREKVVELRISRGNALNNISYLNEAQDLINFVLNSLKEIEDAERNWDKTDTLDLM